MWQIMHRVYLQYLYQYIIKFKSDFFKKNNQTNFIYILKLYIARMRCSRENAVIHRIAHRSWYHFKMKLLWRYCRELCYTFEYLQTLHAKNDKENGGDFYNLVFPGEANMCLVFMSFRAPSASLKQKNYHNSPNMQPIIT